MYSCSGVVRASVSVRASTRIGAPRVRACMRVRACACVRLRACVWGRAFGGVCVNVRACACACRLRAYDVEEDRVDGDALEHDGGARDEEKGRHERRLLDGQEGGLAGGGGQRVSVRERREEVGEQAHPRVGKEHE
eukprot:839187-Pleurochrysis_carterae.AAC.1